MVGAGDEYKAVTGDGEGLDRKFPGEERRVVVEEVERQRRRREGFP